MTKIGNHFSICDEIVEKRQFNSDFICRKIGRKINLQVSTEIGHQIELKWRSNQNCLYRVTVIGKKAKKKSLFVGRKKSNRSDECLWCVNELAVDRQNVT
jgi:hypothetical protein